MKTILKTFVVLLAISMTTFSCKVQNDNNPDDPSGTGTGSTNNSTNGGKELMTPDEQKDYLVEVGKELLNTFNPKDQEYVTDLATNLYQKYESYDWETFFEDQMYEEYGEQFDEFFALPARLAAVASGKASMVGENKTMLLTFSGYGSVFTFDDTNKKINITRNNDKAAIARFTDKNGTNCELKVWGEGTEKEVSFTYTEYHWEHEYDEQGNWISEERIEDGERTIRVMAPATIKGYFKHGSKEIMSFTFVWDSNLKDYINQSMKAKVANVSWEEESKVSTKNASMAFTMKYGDKTIITAAASVPKYEAYGWDNGGNITEDNGEEWLEEYGDRYETVLGSLGKGEAALDILGKIQIKAAVSSGSSLYDEYMDYEDRYYNYNYEDYNVRFEYTYTNEYDNTYDGYIWCEKWWEEPNYSLEAKKKLCDIYGKYMKASMYYGNNIEQAQLKLQPKAESDIMTFDYIYDWHSNCTVTGVPSPISYTYYDIEPIMFFPKENTSFAALSYFESSKFNILMDMTEDLLNDYLRLDKEEFFWESDDKIELDY